LKRKPTAIMMNVAAKVIAATVSSNLSTVIELSTFEQLLREWFEL
jgi:hypothetical protein